MKHFIFKMIFTRKSEKGNGYSYEEANPFLTNLPTYIRFLRCKNGGKEGWNFCLERGFLKKEREKLHLKNIPKRIIFGIFVPQIAKMGWVYL